ncbi:MAG: hypothetical protein ACLVEJ_14465 [Parabacteroides sp.]
MVLAVRLLPLQLRMVKLTGTVPILHHPKGAPCQYASSHTAGIKVEYRFYLGDNLTNNYNIQRDHHYDLTINIKGANRVLISV